MLKEKTIVLYGSRDALRSELTDRLTANGARIFCLDPTTDPDPGDLLAGIGEPVDGLIFLPVSSPDHPVSGLDSATITTATTLSITTPLLIVREAVNRLFRPKSPASIIFTVDPAALDAADGFMLKSITGGALIGAARSLALELGARGIRVNCVCPGQIRDQISAEEASYVALIADIPRPAEPGEIAGPYLYLMSDYSTHVSGQVIRVDGGIR